MQLFFHDVGIKTGGNILTHWSSLRDRPVGAREREIWEEASSVHDKEVPLKCRERGFFIFFQTD